MSALFVLLSTVSITLSKNCDGDFKNIPNQHKHGDRVYYIACVEREWDYAPTNFNLVTGEPITEDSEEGFWAWGNRVDRIGSIYVKALYRAYTDNCFDEELDLGETYAHLGALGPPIRAITGETMKIFYKNMCSFPNSMHPHGVFYKKLSEGAPYQDPDGINPGDLVAPGDSHIYVWGARKDLIDKGTSSKLWLYHSHVDEVRDLHTGLFGPIIITQRGFERSQYDLMPIDVDREFTTFMVEYDENLSMLFSKSVERFLDDPDPSLFEDDDFYESNEMYSINGLIFGNLNTLTSSGGEIIRWYTASFGDETDGPHSPHWHGNIGVDTVGDNTDTVVLIPGTTSTVTMTVDNPGKWLYHCHVFDHIESGMITTYTVGPFPDDFVGDEYYFKFYDSDSAEDFDDDTDDDETDGDTEDTNGDDDDSDNDAVDSTNDDDDDYYYYYYYYSDENNGDSDDSSDENKAIYCCNGLSTRTSGRCLGITDEEKCDKMRSYCYWDESQCYEEITCDLRGAECDGNSDNNCCSGYCNRQYQCS